MDVRDPSNFGRLIDILGNSNDAIDAERDAVTFEYSEIAATMSEVYKTDIYLRDSPGACGFLAWKQLLEKDEKGIFLETAHPAKFKDTVEPIVKEEVKIPESLQGFMQGKKDTVELSGSYADFKELLLKNK